MKKYPKLTFDNLWVCRNYNFEVSITLYIEIFSIYIDFYKINVTLFGFNLGLWYYQ